MSEKVEDTGQLLRRIKGGSEKDFDRFYNNYIPFVYKIAIQILKNKKDAEDVSHDIFIEVIMNPEKFDPARGSIESFLAVKTRSRCYDLLRKVKVRRYDDLQDYKDQLENHEVLLPEEEVMYKEQKNRLLSAIKRLPDLQQTVIEGKYFGDKTQRELAAQIEKPVGTIKSMIRYGLNNIRKELDKDGWTKLRGGEHRE